jgi:hypothetical protein
VGFVKHNIITAAPIAQTAVYALAGTIPTAHERPSAAPMNADDGHRYRAHLSTLVAQELSVVTGVAVSRYCSGGIACGGVHLLSAAVGWLVGARCRVVVVVVARDLCGTGGGDWAGRVCRRLVIGIWCCTLVFIGGPSGPTSHGENARHAICRPAF